MQEIEQKTKKNLTSVGLLYNVEVIEGRIKHHEKFTNIYIETFVNAITVLGELPPMNCCRSPR